MKIRGLKTSTDFLLFSFHEGHKILHERERAPHPILLSVSFLIASTNTIRMSADRIRKPADTIRKLTVMSEKVCKILLVLALMLGVPQAWGKFVMLIYLCHFT